MFVLATIGRRHRFPRLAAGVIPLMLLLALGAGGARGALASATDRLAGAYVPATAHPFVFADAAAYDRLLTTQTPIVQAGLSLLGREVSQDIGWRAELTAVYSGCDLDEYLHRLSYEEKGAARSAADLALYAYLASRGKSYGRPDLARSARDLAKEILLGWARGGLRDHGKVRTEVGQFCENGRTDLVSRLDVGLQIGRGMAHWAMAQDLLLALNAFDAGEQHELDDFLDRVDQLMVNAANFWAEHARRDCERYSNHTSNHILALLAIARLRNDPRRFAQAATGAGGGLHTPWTLQVDRNIYGHGDRLRQCYTNDEAPKNSFQIDAVAPGEIVDRYRSGPLQTLGYPNFSLTSLLLGAKILRNAGFRPMQLRGEKGQSLPLALDYYAYYYTTFMSDKPTVVTPRRGRPYPGEAQYIGHPVTLGGGTTINGKSDKLLPFLIGYCLDPHDRALAALVAKAMSFAPRIIAFYAGDMIAADCLAVLPAP